MRLLLRSSRSPYLTHRPFSLDQAQIVAQTLQKPAQRGALTFIKTGKGLGLNLPEDGFHLHANLTPSFRQVYPRNPLASAGSGRRVIKPALSMRCSILVVVAGVLCMRSASSE